MTFEHDDVIPLKRVPGLWRVIDIHYHNNQASRYMVTRRAPNGERQIRYVYEADIELFD